MSARLVAMAVALVLAVSVGLESQGVQSTALPSPTGREPAWAFPVQAGSLPAEPPGPKTVPGSTKQYTPPQIDDLLNPPDWFPDEHKPGPGIVVKGRGGALACGSCHLMSGLGHPESADLTGYTADYIVQQMLDFKAGTRRDYARMNGISKEVSDQESREAAEWFASLPRQKWSRVVEAAMVPRTFVGQGRMRFLDPKASGMEPIGNRIITLPEDQERARLRDPEVRLRVLRAAGQPGQGQGARRDGRRRQDDRVRHLSRRRDEGAGQRAPSGRRAPDLHRAPAAPVQGRLAEGARRAADEPACRPAHRRRHTQHLCLRRLAGSLVSR